MSYGQSPDRFHLPRSHNRHRKFFFTVLAKQLYKRRRSRLTAVFHLSYIPVFVGSWLLIRDCNHGNNVPQTQLAPEMFKAGFNHIKFHAGLLRPKNAVYSQRIAYFLTPREVRARKSHKKIVNLQKNGRRLDSSRDCNNDEHRKL